MCEGGASGRSPCSVGPGAQGRIGWVGSAGAAEAVSGGGAELEVAGHTAS